MDVKTARKYLKNKKLPSEFKKTHDWQNKPDVFADTWQEIEGLLNNSPGLQAKTFLLIYRINTKGTSKEVILEHCKGDLKNGEL